MAKQEQQDKSLLSREELQRLEECQPLVELSRSKGWECLKQILEERIHHTWVDPRDTSDSKDFERKYMLAWSGAVAATEIIDLVSTAVQDAESLTQKMQGKRIIKSYGIGRS